ncbi:MAG TPA: hypothetical protein VJT74_15965, partial [Pyrinomonadaceae bacterium]|nr:hypothetical protein [Pyrinomonadaceae bacterium]
MPAHERDTQLSPFPRLPASLLVHSPAAPVAAPLYLRPFGQDAGDLEVNFGQAARPLLVTALLALCAQDAAGGRL